MKDGVQPTANLSRACEHCNSRVVLMLYNAQQAGELTGYSPQTIANWRDRGFMRYHKIGGRFLYETWMLEDALKNLGYSLAEENITVEIR